MFGIRVGRRPSRRLTGADHTRVYFSSYLGATGRHSGRPAVSSRVGAARPRASDSTPYRRSRSPISARPADGRRRRAMELARVAVRKGAYQALVTAGLTSCTVPPRRPTSTSVASKDTGVAPIDTVYAHRHSNPARESVCGPISPGEPFR